MSVLSKLAPHLPFLRRYARALTGDQAAGDDSVRMALSALASGELALDINLSPRVALYRIFHARIALPEAELVGGPQARGEVANPVMEAARSRLSRLAPASRQAFLLTAMEGFSASEAARIMGAPFKEIEGLIALAQREIDAELATGVLIIEDEPVIAEDIQALVQDLGHRVIGLATTRDEARRAVTRVKPGLVLADIQLADGSSGIDAARDILADVDVPVIFITAFPERLLTGDRPEPAFLITKPFEPVTLKAAIGQALFFHPGRRSAA
jgi:DNA-directed RNA polymerase specialized sigma24 family protein/CheY-like chemotaxis protein